MNDAGVALRLANVTMTFPGVVALRNVTLDVLWGEVHALVGENGAGKSTLMAVAAGALRPDEGTVTLAGVAVDVPSPARMRELGLAVVYQHPALVPDLTVLENLALGVPRAKRPPLRERVAWASQRLAELGLELDPRRRTGTLSVRERHLVEIAKALAVDPSVLVLDEPTEPLSQAETEALFGTIRSASERGVAVVYISHRLRDVERLADRITVLRDGESQGTTLAGTVSEDEILRLIVGRPVTSAFPAKRQNGSTRPLLRTEGFAGDGFAEVDLAVYPGEIVGLAGIEGNGQRELIRSLAGLAPYRGSVSIGERVVSLSSPGSALRAGIVHVPADRHGEGLLLPLSVRENVALQTLPEYSTAGFVRRRKEAAAVARQTRALTIKAASPEVAVDSLSGGNQQKAVLARSLLAGPAVVLADEPTQGVDAAARLELYGYLRAKAGDGTAVIVNSSDGLELEGLCDRILVFSRGHVVAELTGADVTEAEMTRAALTSTRTRARRVTEPSRFQRLAGFLGSAYGPSALLIAIVVALGVYASLRSDDYLTTGNFESFLLLLSAVGFIALGQGIVILLGGIDLSVGPLSGLLVVVASYLVTTGGAAAIGGIAAMLAIALLVGVSNGVLVRGLRLTPVIATLVTFFVLQGVSLILRPTPGGTIDGGVADALESAVGFVPVAFIVLGAAAVSLEVMLRFTRCGVALRAAGSDESAAHRLGVATTRVQVAGYAACACVTLLGALMLMAQIQTGDATAGIEFTLTSIAAVVLGGVSIFGGRGSFVGVLCAAILLQQIVNVSAFLALDAVWQHGLVGVLVLLAAGLYSRRWSCA